MAITTHEGSANFPANDNDVYGLIETLAVQNIDSLKSSNKIIDGFYEYDITDGKVIEEAVIEMAQEQAFDKNTVSFDPADPTVRARYFNNYETKQFQTTIRRDDIRAIIANKGIGIEDVVAKVLDTLTQGEGNYDFRQCRDLLYNADFTNYRTILGGVPATIKGVIYAARDMYNHVKSDNSDLTAYEYVSSVKPDYIRIAMSPKLLNLIDVTELAQVFNLEKEELFGKLVVVDVDDLSDRTYDYFLYVYDKKALGRATRVYDFTQDVIGKTRFTKEYLTVDRAYFHNGLFKGAFLDCSEAAADALSDIITNPTSYTVTKTLTACATTSTVASVASKEPYKGTFTANSGYTFASAKSPVITVTMGDEAVPEGAVTVADDDKSVTVDIKHVTGNLAITLTAKSAS